MIVRTARVEEVRHAGSGKSSIGMVISDDEKVKRKIAALKTAPTMNAMISFFFLNNNDSPIMRD